VAFVSGLCQTHSTERSASKAQARAAGLEGEPAVAPSSEFWRCPTRSPRAASPRVLSKVRKPGGPRESRLRVLGLDGPGPWRARSGPSWRKPPRRRSAVRRIVRPVVRPRMTSQRLHLRTVLSKGRRNTAPEKRPWSLAKPGAPSRKPSPATRTGPFARHMPGKMLENRRSSRRRRTTFPSRRRSSSKATACAAARARDGVALRKRTAPRRSAPAVFTRRDWARPDDGRAGMPAVSTRRRPRLDIAPRTDLRKRLAENIQGPKGRGCALSRA